MVRTWWRRWLERPARTNPSSRKPGGRRPRLGVRLETLEDRLAPAGHCWIGDVNSLWSNPGNWLNFPLLGCDGSPVGDPSPDISFGFPFDPLNFTSVNDLGIFTVNSIIFDTTDIILTSLPGMGLRLTSGIIFGPVAGTNTIRSPLILTGGGAHTVDFEANVARTLNLEGPIGADSATDSLTKIGSGELGLFGDNTFQGGVTVNVAPGGFNVVPSVLAVGSARAAGLGLLRLAGGTLRAAAPVTLANAFTVTANSAIGGNADLTLTGVGNLAAAQQLRVENYSTTTFTNTIGGPGSLRVDAEIDSRIARGKVILSGNNTYAGGTTVASGILGVTTNTALGVGRLTLAGGFFQSDNPNAALTFANAFTVTGTPQMTGANSYTITGAGILAAGGTLNLSNILGMVTLSGNITGAGAILRTAAGSATLVGTNAYTGGTVVRGGTLSVTQNTSLGTGLLDFAGGTLRIAAPVTLANLFQVSGDSSLAGDSSVVLSGRGAFVGSVTFTLTVTNRAATTFGNVVSGVGAIRVAAGAFPSAVATADVNGDGRPDLITADRNGAGVGVLLGNGDGSFQAGRDFSTGAGPVAVAAADVNGDGRPDLITANALGSSVSVLLGNGDGTFQPRRDLGTGAGTAAVAVADVNGDGFRDLITANAVGGNVSVFWGNGDGSFRPRRDFGAGAGAGAVAAADVNGDGRLDLITANAADTTASVLLNETTPADLIPVFAVQRAYLTGLSPLSVVVADVNGDGRRDLVTANAVGGTVSVLRGNGDGTFQPRSDFGAGAGTVAVAAADVNGDGRLDLITANAVGASVSVLLGRADGTFLPPRTLNAGAGTVGVAAADVNGDGRLDLVTANAADATASVLLGNGDGTFQPRSDFAAGVVGVVNFFGANTYTGGTILETGRIRINSAASLGVGLVTLRGGSVEADVASVLPNTITILVAKDPRFPNALAAPTLGGARDLTIQGGVTLLEPTGSLTVSNAAVTTLAGVINGSGQIGLNAPGGILDLTAVNTFTGGTSLINGTLVGNDNVADPTGFDLSFGTGPLALNGGTLRPAGAIRLNNAFSVNGSPILDARHNVTFTGFGNLIAGELTVANNAVVTFTHAAFLNITGPGGIVKRDGGTLVLTSNSDFAGGVTLQGGVLRLSHTNALGVGTLTLAGGTLEAGAAVAVRNSVNVTGSATVAGSNALTFLPGGDMTLSPGATLTVANTAATTIDQVIRGAGTLVVTAGVVTLSGANTYTGPTTVTGGTLLVNGTQAGSAVTVTGASLGGVGLTGPVTLRGSTLLPGTGPGILRNAGNVTLNSASTLTLELNGDNPGSGFDQLVTTGFIDLNSDGGGGARLDLRPGFVPAVGKSFTILRSTGGIRGTFRGLAEGGLVTVGDLSFRITYRGGAAGTDVVLTRVLSAINLTLTSSLNPSNPGRAITFTAQVAAGGGLGAPTGTVTFFEGANVLAVVPLVDGQASFTTSAFTGGTYTISAVYSGDGTFAATEAVQLTQRVASDLTIQVNQRYVRQLYRDLLGREAEAAGLSAFAQRLDDNQITRAGTVLAIQSSLEYRQRVVRDAYRRILGRDVDAAGLAGWAAFLAQGGTAERLDVLLLDSAEFYQGQGGGTNDGFVRAMYRAVLNRTAADSEVQLWRDRFAAGTPRGAIAEGIVASTEANQRVVDGIFRQYLRRAPETNALNGFVTALQNRSATRELVIAAVTASEEYYQKA